VKIQYANKDHFIALARDAQRQEFNRQVNVDRCIDDMDNDGINLIWFSMIHEHKAGVLVDPHMRTIWYVKLKNTMEPAQLALDMTMENFYALPQLNSEEIGTEHEPVV
jgi:hypothetical protein